MSARYSYSSSPNLKFRSQTNLYARPATPSSASSARLSTTKQDGIDSAIRSRKRGRENDCETPVSKSGVHGRREDMGFDPTSARSLHPSPAPLANSKYRLAGGLDTPTAAAASPADDFDHSSATAFRKTWSSNSQIKGRTIFTMERLDRERNGKKRSRSSMEQSSESWSGYMFRVAGGLAGKMWSFCRAGAFTGFTAGGGAGYRITETTPERVDQADNSSGNSDEGSCGLSLRGSTPVPGGFPTDDFETIDYQEEEEDNPRPSKRLQTSQAGDWVVVDSNAHATPERTIATGHSPRSASGLRSFLPRPVSSSGSRARPQTSTARLSSASCATPRAEKPRSASFASARSPVAASKSPVQQRSPSSADLQRITARRKKEERENIAKMRDFNQQLESLIQTGQQALASKVEIEGDPFASTGWSISEQQRRDQNLYGRTLREMR